MHSDLKNKIENIVVFLKKEGKIHLAKEIEENWDKTCLEYSKKINSYKAKKSFEPIIKAALSLEFKRLGYRKTEIEKILNYLQDHRLIQTTPHISPAQKPRFFFTNWLGSLACSKEQYYPVAMFSGVPFSNKTRPGRMCQENGDVNLMPAYMQDELVYRSSIPEKMIETIKTLPTNLERLLPKAILGNSYTAWALASCEKIEKKYLHGKPIFFDFNEVVANYLLLAIKHADHPVYKILFNKTDREKTISLFTNEVFFYGTVKKGKYHSLEAFTLKNSYLESPTRKIKLTPEILTAEIKTNRLCPGLPLGFLAFTFLNDFKCFGSFAQTEYLPMYKKDFFQIPCLKDIDILDAPTENLTTTGGFPGDPALHPLDLYFGKKMTVKKDLLFGETIVAVEDVLLHQNYSSNMTKNEIEKKLKVHLIGICGKGMSALALLLKQKGFEVTGSDERFYDPVASLLVKHKIKILTPHKAKNIPPDADLIVIGRHAKLAQEINEEAKHAFQSGIKIQSMPEALGDLVRNTENTIVAGSFGKSTMTSILAWTLMSAGKDPSYSIGAVPLDFEKNSHLGKGKNFIFEGDEYPSANWDNTSKFLYFRAKDLILISGEHDHLNVFKTEKDYLKPYKELVSTLTEDGLLVASADGKNVKKIAGKTKAKIVYYSFNKKNTWYAKNIEYGGRTSFELWNKNKKITNLETNMLGQHNIENIVGVSAYVLQKNLVTIPQLQKAISTFKGISGRLDLKTEESVVPVYESFGSSYMKAKADFKAIKTHFPNKRLITIFEPHTFSWRNKEAKKWYKDIFNTSSKVILLPPPEHGATTHAQMTFSEIIKEVKKNNKNVYSTLNEKEALKLIEKITKKDNLIVLVSSGSLFGLTKSVPKLMEKMFPSSE
jgi:UDP-N-acetylmuramate: L-alanyl-gamma-D-glutamyl-meso-diaminopimelate ligase